MGLIMLSTTDTDSVFMNFRQEQVTDGAAQVLHDLRTH